jgi:hypothetical protein
MFHDETVSPSESHTYAIYGIDQHCNFSRAVSFTVATPTPKPGATAPHIPIVGYPPDLKAARGGRPRPVLRYQHQLTRLLSVRFQRAR